MAALLGKRESRGGVPATRGRVQHQRSGGIQEDVGAVQRSGGRWRSRGGAWRRALGTAAPLLCGASVEGDDVVEAQPVELEAEVAVSSIECREKEGGATDSEEGMTESRAGGEGSGATDR